MNDIKANVNQAPQAPKPAPVQEKVPAVASESTGRQPEVRQQEQVLAARQEARAASREAQEAKLKEAVTRLNDYVQSVQRDLKFDLDDSSGQAIIKVVDRSTGSLIRQIPDEVALKMARKLQDSEPVNLFNAKV